ncbi:hypothetical protein K0M31_004613 [Melipona bicolor]|uniref:RIM zinc finger domain-containing protein n=1 Tax=Melipona bicolor TaxID=60889 RepID=A0AA40FXH1_9HYME|nr:hypothetical protein K0M31_004613 [Melipona bicolor]
MAAVPDMSHLTPEERSTIEEVIIRQKQEEEKENEIMRQTNEVGSEERSASTQVVQGLNGQTGWAELQNVTVDGHASLIRITERTKRCPIDRSRSEATPRKMDGVLRGRRFIDRLSLMENGNVRKQSSVQQRQRPGERKQDEVKILEERIRACSEKHKKAGVELHATCHICLKTKFADGVGHICNYCSIRCCARCGGKVTLRSNKVGGRDREKETAEIYRPGENRVLRAGTNSHCFSCSFAFSRPDTLREIPSVVHGLTDWPR